MTRQRVKKQAQGEGKEKHETFIEKGKIIQEIVTSYNFTIDLPMQIKQKGEILQKHSYGTGI